MSRMGVGREGMRRTRGRQATRKAGITFHGVQETVSPPCRRGGLSVQTCAHLGRRSGIGHCMWQESAWQDTLASESALLTLVIMWILSMEVWVGPETLHL